MSLKYNHVQKYFLQLEHHISSSVKPSYQWLYLKIPLGSLIYLQLQFDNCFSFFSVTETFEVGSCIFVYSNASSVAPIPQYPFPFWFVIMLGTIKSNENCEAMNGHHKVVIPDNVAVKVYFYEVCLLILIQAYHTRYIASQVL